MPATCLTCPEKPSPFIQNPYASLLFICILAFCMTSSRACSDRHLSPSSKVYELVGSRWVDQGTAYCAGQLDDANQAYLVARSELDFNKVILSTAIRSNDVYQRQQGVCTPPCICVEQSVLSRIYATYREPDSMDGTQRSRLRLELPGRGGMRGGMELHHRGPTSLEFRRSVPLPLNPRLMLFFLLYLRPTHISPNITQKIRALARHLQVASTLQPLSIFSALVICPLLSSATFRISRGRSKPFRGVKQSRKRYVNIYSARSVLHASTHSGPRADENDSTTSKPLSMS